MPEDWDGLKGIYLSKALTCMKNFLYKQELHFCQGDGYFWTHCCMNNLYISHRSLYAQTYQLKQKTTKTLSLLEQFMIWVLLLWIICVIYVLCLSCFCVCSLLPYGHLLGKGWPLGSRLWCLIVFLSLSYVVSWVRCGTWLYRFLIFANFLTLKGREKRV